MIVALGTLAIVSWGLLGILKEFKKERERKDAELASIISTKSRSERIAQLERAIFEYETLMMKNHHPYFQSLCLTKSREAKTALLELENN